LKNGVQHPASAAQQASIHKAIHSFCRRKDLGRWIPASAGMTMNKQSNSLSPEDREGLADVRHCEEHQRQSNPENTFFAKELDCRAPFGRSQ